MKFTNVALVCCGVNTAALNLRSDTSEPTSPQSFKKNSTNKFFTRDEILEDFLVLVLFFLILNDFHRFFANFNLFPKNSSPASPHSSDGRPGTSQGDTAPKKKKNKGKGAKQKPSLMGRLIIEHLPDDPKIITNAVALGQEIHKLSNESDFSKWDSDAIGSLKDKLKDVHHHFVSTFDESQGGDWECVICLDNDFQNHPLTILPCGHTFHKDCIEQLVAHPDTHNYTCPACRHDLYDSLDVTVDGKPLEKSHDDPTKKRPNKKTKEVLFAAVQKLALAPISGIPILLDKLSRQEKDNQWLSKQKS